jgi:HEAT repeat protein
LDQLLTHFGTIKSYYAAVPMLLDLLRDEDEDVRRAASRALPAPHYWEIQGAWCHDAEGLIPTEPTERRAALAIVPALQSALHDENPQVRHRAAIGFMHLLELDVGPQVIAPLQQELSSADRNVRLAVVTAFKGVYDGYHRPVPSRLVAALIPVVTEAVHDTDEEIRLAAADAMRRLDSQPAQEAGIN